VRSPRPVLLLALATALVAGLVLPLARADDWSDPAYLQHDLDNVSRSTLSGRQLMYLADPTYAAALAPAATQTFLTNVGRQVADLPQGRVYATLGQLLPGGAVGDPHHFYDRTPTPVAFLSRTGAKLVGRLWSDGRPGPHPAVVITPGSIQGTQHMYWWAARTLATAGYLVLTFDVQGQSESETFGHAPGDPLPTGSGFPFQQEANFVDGTVDALRFLYATAAEPYVPGGWTAAQVAAAQAAGDGSLSWVNPLAGVLDRTRLALAGHSLGARAVSVVQQCAASGTLWRTLPLCTGRAFPIKAVVGWDGLSASGVVPLVPGMDQTGDGYFLTPQPTASAPDPAANLGAFRHWRAAGREAYALTVRGGTHLEWVDVPYILPSTTYGVRLADHYTLAWIERYTAPTVARRAAAADALVAAPKRDAGAADQQPWRADFLSARHLGAFAYSDAHGRPAITSDVRANGGASPVGDWAGANADQPLVRPA
jgi:dienelactone hydrolase